MMAHPHLPPRRLLLHIGSPKTGSSAIQEALYPHRFRGRFGSPLSRRPSWLAVPPNPFQAPKPSGFIAALYLPFDDLPRYLRMRYARPEQLLRDQRRYRKLLARSLRASRQAVMSSEYLFRFHSDQIAQLRRDLDGWGVEEVRVLLYIRAPEQAYGSFLQQWLKLSTDVSRYHPQAWRYDFRGALERWEEAFPGAVQVRPYGGCVVTDFSSQLRDFLPDAELLSSARATQANTGLSRESLFALQQVLPHVEGMDCEDRYPHAMALARLRQELEAAARQLPGGSRPVRVWPSVAAVLRQRHAADLSWLERHYGVSFDPPPGLDSGAVDPAAPQPPVPRADVPCRLEDLLEPPPLVDVQAVLAAALACRLVDAAPRGRMGGSASLSRFSGFGR